MTLTSYIKVITRGTFQNLASISAMLKQILNYSFDQNDGITASNKVSYHLNLNIWDTITIDKNRCISAIISPISTKLSPNYATWADKSVTSVDLESVGQCHIS